MPSEPRPKGSPVLRRDELSSWLEPLAKALGVALAVTSPSGDLLAGEAPDRLPDVQPIVVRGEHVGRLHLPAGTHGGTRAALLTTLTAHAEARLAIHDFSRRLAAGWKETNFFHELRRVLRDVTEVEAAGHAIVRQLVGVLHADRAAIYLAGTEGLALAAAFPEATAPPTMPGSGPASEPVISTAQGRCRVEVPLRDGERPLGVLALAGSADLALATNLKFLSNVGDQIAQALRLRYLIQEKVRSAALLRELDLAAEIQRASMPVGTPDFPGVRLAGDVRIAHMVGGDGFDFVAHAAGLDVVIADVSGHGVGAGLLIGSYLNLLHVQDLAASTPAASAAFTNAQIGRQVGDSGRYVTAVHLRIARGARRMTWTSLGHPAPLLWRDGVVTSLPRVSGLPAGIDADGRYGEGSLELRPGDAILLYTDGLTEARSPMGAPFGDTALAARFREVAAREPAAIIEALFDASLAYAGGEPPADDQTAVVLKIG